MWLRTFFTVAPSAFGLDKCAGLLTGWEDYLAPWINDLVPGTAHQAMLAVGAIEIVAGICVAAAPRFGGLLVAAWLAGIIVNLVRSEEHTSELQSLMRISYAVFCLKKKKKDKNHNTTRNK